MKLAVIVLACVVAAAHAQFNRASAFAGFGNQYNKQYTPFKNHYRPQSRAQQIYRPIPAPVVPVDHVVPVQSRFAYDDRNANILKFNNEINPDGTYSYAFETDNGIATQEQGFPRNFGGNPPVVPDVAQGSFSWTSPEGKVVSISYIADENGYQPVGDAIPTPPPVPPQIARALEYIARTSRN